MEMKRTMRVEFAEAEARRAFECLQECQGLGEDSTGAMEWLRSAEEELQAAWEEVK